MDDFRRFLQRNLNRKNAEICRQLRQRYDIKMHRTTLVRKVESERLSIRELAVILELLGIGSHEMYNGAPVATLSWANVGDASKFQYDLSERQDSAKKLRYIRNRVVAYQLSTTDFDCALKSQLMSTVQHCSRTEMALRFNLERGNTLRDRFLREHVPTEIVISTLACLDYAEKLQEPRKVNAWLDNMLVRRCFGLSLKFFRRSKLSPEQIQTLDSGSAYLDMKDNGYLIQDNNMGFTLFDEMPPRFADLEVAIESAKCDGTVEVVIENLRQAVTSSDPRRRNRAIESLE